MSDLREALLSRNEEAESNSDKEDIDGIIILQRGLPFEVKIPPEKPVDISTLSEIEFNEELEKGYSDMQAGRIKNAKNVFAEICIDYNL